METIDVLTDTPRCRSEEYLFDLLLQFESEVIEQTGETTRSILEPTPQAPALFTDVIYTRTQTGHGSILRGFGNVADKIVVDFPNRQAHIERNIGVIEFDGTEDWQIYFPSIAPQQGLSFQVAIPNAKLGAYTSICTHYKNVWNAWDAVYANRMDVYTDHASSTSKYFRRPQSEIDTLEEFKQWLASEKANGHGVKVYYHLPSTITENIPFVR